MSTLLKPFLLLTVIFMMNSLNAQDWPNFKEFQEANARLPQVKQNEKRVVFMGNSITIGWLQTHPDFFKNKPYVNRGISGQTTPQMLVRFRPDVVDLDAAAVVLLAGTNDIAGNTGPVTLEMILDNIKSMTEIAQANDIKVILCSVLPAFDYPWRSGLAPNVKIPKLNKMIKRYAEESGAYYLDYFTALEDGNNGMIKEYTTDGVHLTLEGYQVMEPLVENALQKVLN
ncbi:SGNH/GDSL hydrolase family protein [Flavobacteriaceae bacterium]|jgi:lysophospholipase L1-like esterase|nr:SGNH/GDSL hydrolase family protein [Flavobacteriaceae bacterium]